MFKMSLPTALEDINATLLVETTTHKQLGSAFKLKVVIENEGKILNGGSIVLPQSTVGLKAVETLRYRCADILSNFSPELILESRVREAKNPPLSFLQIFSEVMGDRHIVSATHDWLKESITNTPFNLEDFVFAVQNDYPFAKTLNIPLHQVKVLIYYGFQGKGLLRAQDINEFFQRLNIRYDYSYTEALLEELFQEKLIGMIERENQTSSRLWTFSKVNRDHLTTRRRLGEMMEISWRFINPTYYRNGGTLVVPLDKRSISLLEVLSEWFGHLSPKKNQFTFRRLRKFLPLKRISARMQNLEL